MKLIDLLVEEIDEWPKGVVFMYQQPEGEIEGVKMNTNRYRKRRYSSETKALKIETIATNQASAIITKEQWEAAKCQLNAAKNS